MNFPASCQYIGFFSLHLLLLQAAAKLFFQRERVICKAAFLLFKPLEEVACFPE